MQKKATITEHEKNPFNLLRRIKKDIVYSHKYSYMTPELENFGVVIWHRPRKWTCPEQDMTLKGLYLPNDFTASLFYLWFGKIAVWRRQNHKLMQMRQFLSDENDKTVEHRIFKSKIYRDLSFFFMAFRGSGIFYRMAPMFYRNPTLLSDFWIARGLGFLFGMFAGLYLANVLGSYFHMKYEVPLMLEHMQEAQDNGFVDYDISSSNMTFIEQFLVDRCGGLDFLSLAEIVENYDRVVKDL